MVGKFDQIRKFLEIQGESGYRFDQITSAVFKQRVESFEKMTILPKNLRRDLKERFGSILSLKPINRAESKQADKVLFELEDGERIEAVKMGFRNKEREWGSLCISSQVGCGLGCAFCATGKIGLKRNLTVDEIISQPLYFLLEGADINSISFMGMGEPLANPNIFAALKALTDKRLFAFSPRRLSVSTVGIIPALERLSAEFPQINIAFSLHTPFEEQRKELMPIAKQFSIEQVMAVLDGHIKKNRRKVFLPYLMLEGVNDSREHLKALESLVLNRGSLAYLYHINLVRYHSTPGLEEHFKPSSRETIEMFRQELEKVRIGVTVRQSFGTDIQAACGQLYAQYEL
ncbi:23S rRNA (adenine(2503)-C(8))-methyltransferase Cfr [Candidatus Shapirobacteria bacterium]|nr:23S rRNA (adenine(2503)-C(8))-methyltransferase Cfr [Candidatus Shapirobacteria bacterium]